MRQGDFGAKEAFFVLALAALGVVISWALVLFFTTTVEVISSFVNVIVFGVWLMFANGGF